MFHSVIHLMYVRDLKYTFSFFASAKCSNLCLHMQNIVLTQSYSGKFKKLKLKIKRNFFKACCCLNVKQKLQNISLIV